MNAFERVMASLAGAETDRPAVLGVLGAYGGRLTGISLPDIYQSAELYVAGQVATQDTFGLDMVMAPFDYGAIAEAFGGNVAFFENQAPNMRRPGCSTIDDALWAHLPEPEVTGRLPMILQATRLLCERYRNEVPVFAVMPGPAALPVLILGMENWLSAVLFEPDKADALLAYTEAFWQAWAQALSAAGADGLVITEGMAAAEISTPELYAARFHEHIAACFGRVSAPLVFHHTGGRINPVLDRVKELPNLVGVVVSSKDKLKESREIVGQDMALLGNLDNLSFPTLTPEAMRSLALQRLLEGLADGPFLLCNSGADIPTESHPETIHAMRRAAECYAAECLELAGAGEPNPDGSAVQAGPAPTWVCCGVLRDEILALQGQGAITGEVAFTQSLLHMNPPLLASTLKRHLSEIEPPTVLVYGDCCPNMMELAMLSGVARVQATNCAEMLLGRKAYRDMLRKGAFFILPEWTHRWRQVFQDELGLDQATAQDMLRESHTELIYLDTGLGSIPVSDLGACAEYVGLPWRSLKVGLDHLLGVLKETQQTLLDQS